MASGFSRDFISGRVASAFRWKAISLPAEAGSHIWRWNKPVPRIDPGELSRRLQPDRTAGIGRALEGRIVMHHHDAVAGEMDIELEPVGAESEAVIESHESVLGP